MNSPHSPEAQCNIDYRTIHGLGPVWKMPAVFWETHGNLCHLDLSRDVTASGMDVYHIESWGDWKNTYENYALLSGHCGYGRSRHHQPVMARIIALPNIPFRHINSCEDLLHLN
ncbi:MAG: hypothetical protein IPJ06_04225 [Saprospiraceae bacterium]|nr:hypothetical protein [Saprospiraceae bacterium]